LCIGTVARSQEISHLTNSFATLQAANARFRRGKECVDSLATYGNGTPSTCVLEARHEQLARTDKPVLVPLTSSLYVPGKLKHTDTVIVDVGTGYFVRKVRGIRRWPTCVLS
jgi:prefoldin alpha subunit